MSAEPRRFRRRGSLLKSVVRLSRSPQTRDRPAEFVGFRRREMKNGFVLAIAVAGLAASAQAASYGLLFEVSGDGGMTWSQNLNVDVTSGSKNVNFRISATSRTASPSTATRPSRSTASPVRTSSPTGAAASPVISSCPTPATSPRATPPSSARRRPRAAASWATAPTSRSRARSSSRCPAPRPT